MTKRHTYTNRLISEKSPYLLQHAHNPIDWYPWSEDAFNQARAQDKPIFLSIGYATCHWCHVMEKESFENVEVAKLMNDTFINIKVDREELPEVDTLYMEFAQSMMAGAAGWPLNVILTPDLQPFFAATYLPSNSKHGLMGLSELVSRIKEVWQSEEREQVVLEAEKIVGVFAQSLDYKGDEIPPKEQVADTAELLFRMADSTYGGMKGIPKFPIGYQFNFMLRYGTKAQDSRALFLVELTLDMMQRGGIYDHLGGGFSRYSIDEKWLVPHFEKMLYDNALLAYSYLEAWQTTKKPLYRQICEEILDYILRAMTHAEGGFYSAEDADTEGKEGYYYTWTMEEIQDVLGIEESDLFCEFYGVTEEGNFEGRNILNIEYRLEEFAAQLDKDPMELAEQILPQKQKLFKARSKRVSPFIDDKILTGWNGLMIHTMAEAGAAFKEPRFSDAAVNAAKFIRKNLWVEGQLMRRWREDDASFHAGLDDYSFLIRGLITLFETGAGSEWLGWAMELGNILDHQFKTEGGGYYQTDGTDPSIIIRKCQFADGSEPAGNSIHCENLLRFYQLTQFPDYFGFAEDILRAVKKYIDNYPPGYCYQMINLNRYYDREAPTVVIALNEREQYREELLHLFYSNYSPHKALIWRREDDEELFSLIPSLRENPPINRQTTLYICRQGVCQEPITDLAEMLDVIHHL